MSGYRVLVVDDSAVVRRLLTSVLEEDPALEVAGSVPHGGLAVESIPLVRPDLVVLDVEMPEMDGLAALKVMRARHPDLKVVMFSVRTERGAEATLDALALGAVDYVTKPKGAFGREEALRVLREELVPKIKAICGGAVATEKAPRAPVRAHAGPPDVVAVAASTGGPEAIRRLLGALPRDLDVPLLVAQHMPPVFTRRFADRLAARTGLAVAEASHGVRVQDGLVWIAPGGLHLEVRGADLSTSDEKDLHRPSADRLFRSVAAAHGPRALAVVLTGMGSDGLAGSAAIHAAGGRVFAQCRKSSVVWGMPGLVVEAGLAERVATPEELAAAIAAACCEGSLP